MKKRSQKIKMLMGYYSNEDLKSFKKISNKAALTWLEEASKFFYHDNPGKLKKEEIFQRRIGW